MKRNPIFARTGKLAEILEHTRAVPTTNFAELKRSANACFKAYSNDDGTVAEIDLYDVIGTWETNAAIFRSLLNEIDADDLVLNINSPGGSVFDGLAMYNDLRAHKARVHVRIRGLAASAASLVAMAGDTITMADNAFMMIHNAWTVAVGDQNEMREQANVLAQVDKSLARTYAGQTGLKVEAIAEMMHAETWMDSEDAEAKGFIHEISEAVDAKALAHDVSAYKKPPAILRQARMEPVQPLEREAPAPAAAGGHVAMVSALNKLTAAISNPVRL